MITVPYIGITSDLTRRMWEHKNKVNDGFTKKYRCDRLMYYEFYDDIREAIIREKKLKDWHHDWKMRLIKRENPSFEDLSKAFGF